MPVLPVRSAAPEMKPGTESRQAVRTFAMAWRVATLVPSSNAGSPASQPFTPVPAQHASHAARSPGQPASRFSQA